MSEQQILLKTVFDLRVDTSDQPIRYRIPAYQRGYRWTSRQVSQLLEDIRDFAQRENPQPEEFYCLQPLVIRANNDGAYEVVDGQQRLTTLLLILRHFNARLTERYQQKLYSIQYDTRADLLTFLENRTDERAVTNIDFYYVNQAAKTIESWFEERESEVETIKSAFLNKAKIIWFQLSDGEDPVDAFTRLNVGKIPLTNGELIRALFLRKAIKVRSAEALRLRIGYEWDLMEKDLQKNEFWCFLSNDTEKAGNRIGFLFDHVARQDGMQYSSDAYSTFYHFSQKLNAKDAELEREWLAVKKAFMLLGEWFEDRRLYHLAGFLIWRDVDINVLRDLAKDCTKDDFKNKLRAKIFELTIGSSNLANLTSDDLRECIVDRLEPTFLDPKRRFRDLARAFGRRWARIVG